MKSKLPINPSVYHKLGKQDPRRVDAYLEGSGGGSAMSGAAGMSLTTGKNTAVSISGYGGKDEYGGYGGYSVSGKVSIPLKRRKSR